MDITLATRPGGLHINEDFAAAAPRAVVVLDGVSVPEGMDTGCEHGTPWLVRELGTRLLAGMTTRLEADLPSVLACAIREVTGLHSGTCDLTHPGTPASTVAMLRASGPVEYLALADSAIILETGHGIQVIQDERVESTAVRHSHAVLAAAGGSQAHAEARREMVTVRRGARNRDGGYWVASTSPMAAFHALTGSIRPGRVRRAAVLTDGAARLAAFGVMGWEAMLDVLDLDGPAALLRQVREAEDSDPAGVRWPRSKASDDATAVFCRFL